MRTKYKSQCREDIWIEKNWRRLQLPEKGFFVEFGAMDGCYLSNTYWLEKTKGWSGLLCEPDPRQVIKDRPNSIVEQVAIGPRAIVSFGLDELDYGLSGILRPSGNRIEIECVPLTEILKKHHILKVDLISIDTEGTELEAWKTLDLCLYRPTVAIIELVTWKLPDRADEIISALRDDGYFLMHRTKYNGIFKRID